MVEESGNVKQIKYVKLEMHDFVYLILVLERCFTRWLISLKLYEL